MLKVLVIAGPTAVGKSDFGIKAARKYDGEIISGDSVQIYKGFNIGSGKVAKDEMEGIPHFLIDVKEHGDDYSAAEFQSDGRKLIESISKRKHLPIVVGGTGLYLKSLLYDYYFMSEDRADDQYEDLSNEMIYERLRKVDPLCLEKIHLNNRRRLVRALNIYEKNKIGISTIKEAQKHEMIYDALMIGLTCERKRLYERIDKRVDKMFDDGLIEEVKGLIANGASFDDKPMGAIGYRQFEAFFNEDIDEAELRRLIKRDSRRFAKRQYTWFNHQLPLKWFDIDDLDSAMTLIGEWYDR